MQLKRKFVAYIDIVGFKNLVETAEKEGGMSLDEILEIVATLGKSDDRKIFEAYGPMMCPESRCVQRHLDFQIIQISDCAILSTEISPAGIINLIERSWRAVILLLQKGLMCRGYITCGPIYHTANQIIGSGYHKAHAKESVIAAFAQDANDRGTPFVEIDPVVAEYVRTETDECVRKMFGRLVKSEGSVTAIFPFKLLSHSFPFGPLFSPEKERQSNDNLRQSLRDMKTKVLNYVAFATPAAKKKAEHYARALDEQLAICDKTDEMIGRFGRSSA